MNMKTRKTKPITNNAPIQAKPDAKIAESKAEQAPSLASRELIRRNSGGRSDEVAQMLFFQAHSLLTNRTCTPETARLSLGMLGEMAPRNAIEGMLAVQMIGVHNAAVEFIKRSQLPGQTVGGVDSEAARAARLMRLSTEQLDAMAKLKGTAGQQKMTVEHVHVHAGGQAIVGPVARGNGDVREGGDAK
jgi:hypothetical protein